MKRLWLAVFGLCALGGAVFTSGCGPGLVALGGGGTGTFFGLQGGDDDKKSDDGGSQPSTNVIPAIVISNLVRSESPATINYTIIDANNDLCSIEVEFSVGGGAFSTATEGTGGDGTTGLGSSTGGTPHTFAWDFQADFGGPQATTGITLRIRANDGTVAGNWFELQNQIIGNDAPVIVGIQEVGVDPTVPSLLTFTLFDESSDLCTFEVRYSIDQGDNPILVDSSEFFGNPPQDMPTSPSGTANQFIWDSSIALPDYVGDVTLIVTPKDQPSGYSAETTGTPVQPTFFVENVFNDPPEVVINTVFDGTAYTGVVPASITVSDDEFDTAVVFAYFTVDDGVTWFPATMRTQFAQGVVGPFGTNPPETRTVYWEALTDFADTNIFPTYTNNYAGTVRLAFAGADAQLNPNPEITDLFSVTGNSAPEVLDIAVFQDSGNIPVAIGIEDFNSHPVNLYASVGIEVSVDGSTYLPLPVGDFVFGDPTTMPSSPVGLATVLIWDTTSMFDGSPFQFNEASVTLRITPTDQPPGTPPAAHLTGAAFVSSPFPVINDPNGTDPVSIDVFTTDAGPPEPSTTVTNDITVVPGSTVYLNRIVNPGSALISNTLWKIVETGDDYGTLSDPYTTPNTMQFATGSLALNPPGAGTGFAEDGETFTIHDGLNGPRILEFDTNSLATFGTVVVDISTATTANDVAVAVADAINNQPDIRITAAVSGTSNFINLTHEIACRLGNTSGPGSNANPIGQFGDPLSGFSDMSGGDGTDWVRYDAPTTPPAGTDFVTIFCEIDDPSFYQSVQRSYVLYWGEAPTSVDVTPLNQTILEDEQVQFSATVNPAGAPQIVEWSIISGPGTIDPDTGLYTAPSTVSGSTFVEVQAASVNPAVRSMPPGSPQYMVEVLPRPQSISVTVNFWNGQFAPPELELSQSTQPITADFNASVSPTGAPSGVVWRIFWNGANRGAGDPTVGTIDQTGLYTAPLQLPSSAVPGSPNDLFVEAVSTVDSSVIGFFQVFLKAPAPTSFVVTPSSATVTAGGAGQQFDVTNFMPTNANKSVTWSVNPQVGTINPSTGFYSPPSSSPGENITVRAVSNVAGTVESTASLTINPATGGSPTGVTISPIEGIVQSGGATIQFNASVQPGTVNQDVTWSIVAPAQGATIGATTGIFTPPSTTTDIFVTVRCDTVATPSLSATVDVCVTGSGLGWTEQTGLNLGRGAASFVWETNNDRLWVIGGHSSTSTKTGHIRETFYFADNGNPYNFRTGPTIDAAKPTNQHPNTISAVYDDDNERLLALVGTGPTSPVQIWELDVSGSSVGSWNMVVTGGTGASVPNLGGDFRYHSWFEPNDKIMYVLGSRSTLYRFDTGSDVWATSVTISSTNNGPANPELTGFAWDGSFTDIDFVGASDVTVNAKCENYTLERFGATLQNFRWKVRTQTGSFPSTGIVGPSTLRIGNTTYLFGGRRSTDLLPNTDLYDIFESGGTYDWQLIPLTPGEERPASRMFGAFTDGPAGALLFGGEKPGASGGTFGDVWEFDLGSLEFIITNPDEIRPQGRVLASAAWANGEGLAYGGICDHGPSNELWAIDVSGTTPDYIRISTTGDRPPALAASASTFIELDDAFVVYGGSGVAGLLSDEMYAFNITSDTWTLINFAGPKPAARQGAAICYDSGNDRIWMFGGDTSSNTKLNDIWYIDLSAGGIFGGGLAWTEITSPLGPKPDERLGATIGYDATFDRLLVIGGESQSGPNQQLYEFDIPKSEWRVLNISNPANGENVFISGAVYDDECSRFFHLPPTRKRADALVMGTNGPKWQNLLSPTLENNTIGSTGFYDPLSGRYHSVFGEKTVAARLVGTNVYRSFAVK